LRDDGVSLPTLGSHTLYGCPYLDHTVKSFFSGNKETKAPAIRKFPGEADRRRRACAIGVLVIVSLHHDTLKKRDTEV
jgi:hypothetical protein